MHPGEKLTFCLIEAIGNYGKQAVPVLTEKLLHAKGDFKYAIIVILSDISAKLDYNKSAQDYIPLYEFSSDLLPFCIEGLQSSESGRIRARMAWILGENKYTKAVPVLKDALTDEYTICAKEGVLYPVRRNAKAALEKMGVTE